MNGREGATNLASNVVEGLKSQPLALALIVRTSSTNSPTEPDMGMADAERLVRERLGLFAKAEPPPTPAQMDPSLFRQYVQEAAPYLNFLSAPMGLGLAGARVALPQTPRPLTGEVLPPAGRWPIDPSRGEQTIAHAWQAHQAAEAAPATGGLSGRPSNWYSLTPKEQHAWIRSSPNPNLHLAGYSAEDIARIRAQGPPIASRGPYIEPPPIPRNDAPPPLSRADVDAILGPRTQGGPAWQEYPAAPAALRAQATRSGNLSPAPTPPAPASPPGQYGDLGHFVEPTTPGATNPRPSSLTNRIAYLPEPARRQLGYEMPLSPIKERQGSWTINYEPGGDVRGQLYAYHDPVRNELRVSSSDLPRSAQGQGIGLEMYTRMFDEAHRRGLTVKSDAIQSNKSFPLYKYGLRDRGYDVQLNPNYYRVGGQYPHRGDEGVWTVGPKEPLTPAYGSLMDRLKMKVPQSSPYIMAPLAPFGAGYFQPEDRLQ